MTNALVPYQSVNIAGIAAFHMFSKKATLMQLRLHSMMGAIAHVNEQLACHYEPELKRIKQLKLELRAIQRGVPVQDVSEFDTGSDAFEVNPAEAQMCSRLWRKLAKRLHPDYGGDAVQFDLARTAYDTKDVVLLTHMYHQTFDFSNPAWLSENWGFAKERYERLKVQVEYLKETPDFEVARLYQTNRKDEAKTLLGQLINIRIINLMQQILQAAQ